MTKNAINVAIGGKADMTFCSANVCLWPKADMGGTFPGAGLSRYDAPS